MVEFSAAGDKSDTESDDSGAEGLFLTVRRLCHKNSS